MNDSALDNTNCEEQKTKKRSLVWNFFEEVSRQRVQCRLCKHEQNYQGTTGNILRHLKARHDLDATIKGQQDPKNQALIKQLMKMTSPAKVSTVDRKPIVKASISSDSSDTLDPYNDENKQTSFNNVMFYENVAELQEDCINNCEKTEQVQKSTKKSKLEEDRILAETEYYREKAAYFRIQKHFTALQAKKIKLEIEQIILNNKNNT